MIIDPENAVFIADADRISLREQRKIIISGEIDSGTAQEFITDIAILINENVEPITVIISSNGGNAEYGNGCIRAIREAQKAGVKVIGSVYGQAMSMAFFILQTCDERIMGELDTIMAHGLTASSVGDMKSRDAEDKLLKFFQNEYSKLIANRCKKYDVRWWKRLLTDNTPRFFNGPESLDIGLVDKVE